MDFYVKLDRSSSVLHNFSDGCYEPYDTSKEEPVVICGEICADDHTIGRILLYELYNNTDFYELCDAVSGDCERIANTICSKSGRVLKRLLPPETEYAPIYILDHLEIKKEYRNRGIGSTVASNLPNMIHYEFGVRAAIFLCASDYESADQHGFASDEYKEGTKRLIQFYKESGYRVIKGNIMMYSSDEIE